MTSFIDWPVELQQSVIHYITSYADLKSLCRTCKQLHSVAIERLYHTVDIDVDQLEDNRLIKIFRSNRAGVRYVRELKIRDRLAKFAHNHRFHLLRLIQMLQKNELKVFSLNSLRTFARDMDKITFMLHKHQHSLETYELYRLDSGDPPSLLPTPQVLDPVKTLSFILSSVENCKLASCVLWLATHVENLRLRFDYGRYALRHNEAAFAMEMFQALFKPWTERSDGPKLKLKSLLIQNADLYDVGAEISTFLDPPSLEEITLVRCKYTAELQIAITYEGLNLKSFRNLKFFEEVEEGDECYNGALFPMLRSFKGLRQLHISQVSDSEEKEDCGFIDIEHHGQTLRSLVLDDFYAADVCQSFLKGGRGMDSFRSLCYNAPSLEQLAIRPPKMATAQKEMTHDFLAFLGCLKGLRNLTSLRLFDYSSPPAFYLTLPAERVARRAFHMQAMADKIFSELQPTCRRLQALLIDTRAGDGDLGPDSNTGQFGYLRGQQTSLYGQFTVKGVAVSALQLRRYEGHPSIFSDDFLVDKE